MIDASSLFEEKRRRGGSRQTIPHVPKCLPFIADSTPESMVFVVETGWAHSMIVIMYRKYMNDGFAYF